LPTREPFERQATLPGVEPIENLPFPTMEMKAGRYKVFGLVSNMDWMGRPDPLGFTSVAAKASKRIAA